jgi:hypothetical protein
LIDEAKTLAKGNANGAAKFAAPIFCALEIGAKLIAERTLY